MPRIARGLIDGFIYHVLNRGNGGQKIFNNFGDYKVFIELMKEAKERFPVKIFAYCLMPNHFHLVVMPVQGKELSRFMQWLMTAHVRRYHRHYGGSGHIWQGRFKSFIIQEDEHLLTVLRYVEGNSVRAGLVKSVKDWRWSSSQGRHNEDFRLEVDDIPIDLPRNWDDFVNEPLTERELAMLHQSKNRASPYGEAAWQLNISRTLGLESTLRPLGRPKKNKHKENF